MTKNNYNEAWSSFQGSKWKTEINVRDFIQHNYTQYNGDEKFLTEPTDVTNKLWSKLQDLQKQERNNGGVLDCETEIVSGLTAYGPGYLDKKLERRWFDAHCWINGKRRC